MATNSAACGSSVFEEDMVFEIAGHCKAPLQCTPMPRRLFRADPSVKATDVRRSTLVALLMAVSRLQIIMGAAGTHRALETASIFSNVARSKSLNFSAMRWRGACTSCY